MAPDPVSQARIYDAIKRDLLAGLIRPGARIEIKAIADRHRTSTTPVREVLHRLEGERLLEAREEGGFRLAIPDAAGLRHLYAWNAHILCAALAAAAGPAIREALQVARRRAAVVSAMNLVDQTDVLFLSIGAATGNPEFVENIRNASERLRYLRIVETAILSGMEDELVSLVRNGHIDVRGAMVRRVKSFHARRIEYADNIVAELEHMYTGGSDIAQF